MRFAERRPGHPVRHHPLLQAWSTMVRIGEPNWACEAAQPHVPDIVLAAGLFQPNAVGRFELSSFAGFQQRQLLKSRGTTVWERMLLAITPIELLAVEVLMGSVLCPVKLHWPLSSVRARPVRPKRRSPDLEWPGVRLERVASGRVIAELRVVHHDDSSLQLLDRLIGPGAGGLPISP